MPSAQNIHLNGTGGMPNSCSMAAAPMKFCVTIWEGSSVKIKIQISKSKCQMNSANQDPKHF
jgi:hypothetical protein